MERKKILKHRSIASREKDSIGRKHWIRLTKTCNNKCLFCLDSDNQDGSIISKQEIKNKLLEGRGKKIKEVIFSGGEPTIHPDFIEIIGAAKKMGYSHVQVVTNGRMFAYHDFLMSAANNGMDEITFSIHGHSKELHESQSQIKGSFKQTFAGLQNAIKMKNLKVNISVVVNKLNFFHLLEMVEYFEKLGINKLYLHRILPLGRAWKNRDSLITRPNEDMSYIRKVLKFSVEKNITVELDGYPSKYLDHLEKFFHYPFDPYTVLGCWEGMFNEFIFGKGKIPCFEERCRHCPADEFCRDLRELVQDKKLNFKNSFCYPKKNPGRYDSKKIRELSGGGIFDFFYFFINFRFFAKGQKCNICKFDKKCDGVPADFAKENGLKMLRPFSAEIAENSSILLSLSGVSHCDLNCVFCSGAVSSRDKISKMKNEKVVFDLDDLKFYLLLIRECYPDAVRLCIGGNEPLKCDGILQIIRHAKKIGFKKISLETTGMELASGSFTNLIVRSGVGRFELPIYGQNQKIHDQITRTKGSFNKLMNAIKNLKKNPNVEIVLHSLLLKQNYSVVPDIYKFIVKKLKLRRIDFRKVRPVNSDATDYGRVCPRYADIRMILNKEAFMPRAKFDIPFCVLPDSYLKILFAKDNKKFNELFLPALRSAVVKISSNGVAIEDSTYNRYSDTARGRLSKSSKCENCKLSYFCRGVPKLYLDLYGDKEIKPFKSISPALKTFLHRRYGELSKK
ncbi:MAG: radical SAM protein [Candidatus Moranbacteria bacterium]|nr:radical SAM protein [Candidatus Moranbacteria bacterium]